MSKKIIGWRRVCVSWRKLSDFVVIGEGAHRQVVLRETLQPERTIEPIYEGEEDLLQGDPEQGGTMSDPATEFAPPAPLAAHESARMSELLALPARTPEQHSELTDLWTKAKSWAETWKPDAELAQQHLLSFADNVTASMRQIAALIPAAAGISALVARADQALHNLKLASVPPEAPPELPPAPVVDEPQQPGPEDPPVTPSTDSGTASSPPEGPNPGA